MLEIHPSRRTSSIMRCSLVAVDVDHLEADAVPFYFYEALSYTWGGSTDKVGIKLDGHAFYVTRNLAAALRRLRAKEGCRYLWVDAICINQVDKRECSSQVAKMDMIYRRAEQVLVWLGDEADGSARAMDLIDRISDADTTDDWVAASLDSETDLEVWRSVAKLFDRPYWRRVWIRQEVSLAADIVVLCGQETRSWDAFVEAASVLERHEGVFNEIAASNSPYVSGYYAVMGIDSLRETVRKGGGARPDDVLFHLRVCECSDARDYIYGGLGMCPLIEVEVDYGLDRVAVFTNATIAAIRGMRSLNILCGCQDPLRSTGLPSWVPDFGADWKARKFRHRENNDTLDFAGSSREAAFSFSRARSGLMALSVRGVVADMVVELCPEIDNDSTQTEAERVLERWRSTASKTLSAGRPRLTETEMRFTFWRTITANEDEEGLAASDEFLAEAQLHTPEGCTDPIPPVQLGHVDTTFISRFWVASPNRRLISTKKGRVGLAPTETKEGDLVVVLFGASLPFILRSEEDHYILVGETCE